MSKRSRGQEVEGWSVPPAARWHVARRVRCAGPADAAASLAHPCPRGAVPPPRSAPLSPPPLPWCAKFSFDFLSFLGLFFSWYAMSIPRVTTVSTQQNQAKKMRQHRQRCWQSSLPTLGKLTTALPARQSAAQRCRSLFTAPAKARSSSGPTGLRLAAMPPHSPLGRAPLRSFANGTPQHPRPRPENTQIN